MPSHKDSLNSKGGFRYTLPDGTNLEVTGYEQHTLGEPLFTQVKDDDVNMTDISRIVPSLITESINSVDHDIRKEMYNSIILTGGNSNIKGFYEWLNKDLPMIAPQSLKVKVINANGSGGERRYSTWMGGSILASLGSFQQMWMSKQEYEEHGSSIVERKCP